MNVKSCRLRCIHTNRTYKYKSTYYARIEMHASTYYSTTNTTQQKSKLNEEIYATANTTSCEMFKLPMKIQYCSEAV